MYPDVQAEIRLHQPAFIMARTGETVSYAELGRRNNRLAHPGTVGRVRLGEWHVLDDDIRPVAVGTPGTIWVRRDNTWIVRPISSSRPITGSSLPSRAASVRSRVYDFPDKGYSRQCGGVDRLNSRSGGGGVGTSGSHEGNRSCGKPATRRR
jgi:hypothetical protein